MKIKKKIFLANKSVTKFLFFGNLFLFFYFKRLVRKKHNFLNVDEKSFILYFLDFHTLFARKLIKIDKNS